MGAQLSQSNAPGNGNSQAQQADPEMLKDLDMFQNYDALTNESSWNVLSSDLPEDAYDERGKWDIENSEPDSKSKDDEGSH